MNKSAETNFGISTYSGERVKADKTGLWSCMKNKHQSMSCNHVCGCKMCLLCEIYPSQPKANNII